MKKNLYFLVILCICASLQTRAQGCLPNGIAFSTQSEVNAFPGNYPGCSEILGGVFIDGADIVSLDSLSQIEKIGGQLLIGYSNRSLKSLKGLNNLTWVGGSLGFGAQ